jgi:hypothetical protein
LLGVEAMPTLYCESYREISIGGRITKVWGAKTYVIMHIITRKVPRMHPLRTPALRLCPRAPICQRAKDAEHEYDRHEDRRGDLQPHPRAEGRGGKVEHGAPEQDGKVQRGEVVVQEELPGFEEEGEVVQSPAHEEEATDGVVFDDFG